MSKFKKGDIVVIMYGALPMHKKLRPIASKYFMKKCAIVSNLYSSYLVEFKDNYNESFAECYLKLVKNCPEYLKQ